MDVRFPPSNPCDSCDNSGGRGGTTDRQILRSPEQYRKHAEKNTHGSSIDFCLIQLFWNTRNCTTFLCWCVTWISRDKWELIPKKKNSRDRLSLKGCSQSVLAGQMLENMQYYVVTYSVYTVHNIYEYRNVTSVGSPADSECNLIQNNFIYLWFVKQLQATKYQKSVWTSDRFIIFLSVIRVCLTSESCEGKTMRPAGLERFSALPADSPHCITRKQQIKIHNRVKSKTFLRGNSHSHNPFLIHS